MRDQHHGMKDFKGLPALCAAGVNRSDRFGRMLPDAPALYLDPRDLSALGAAGGPMEGPKAESTSVGAGMIFFGQFIDHDVTFDTSSSFQRLDRPEATTNVRTPTLDLDCVYGDGPEGSPFMYWSGRSGPDADFNGVKLLTAADAATSPGTAPGFREQDVPRASNGRAIIGDPRNDENRIISQMQLGFLRFHNKVADALHAKGGQGEHLFAEARRVSTFHYQWIVVQDFLRRLAGGAVVDRILGQGRTLYRPETCPHGTLHGAEPFMPVEFAVAAYRFGHSMIPDFLRLRAGGAEQPLFGTGLGAAFTPVPSMNAVVEWPMLLDLSVAGMTRAEKLDGRLMSQLLALPFVADLTVNSLAVRNFLRAQAFMLPSGETMARACARPELEIEQVAGEARARASAAGASLSAGVPLWYYLLLEAELIGRESSAGMFEPGEGLGPAGPTIVAETLIGLLELDTRSYLGSNRAWHPAGADKLGDDGVFTLLQLLTF